jgi:hypothetical protein
LFTVRADEWDRLASALNALGIRYIAPHRRVRGRLPEGAELFRELVSASAVRLQEAIIPLLLTRPDLASAARVAIDDLHGVERDRAMRKYVAAAALQRMWRTRLQQDLGPGPPIAEAYVEELGLPPLDEDYGRATLRALSGQEEARYGYNAWAGYTSLMDMFLAEICGMGRDRTGAGLG